MQRTRRLFTAGRLILVAANLACTLYGGCFSMGDSGAGAWNSGGEFGATQGGVQDMTLARSLVEEGMVPPPEAFAVEAMFSEHDLPLEGEPCSTTLCLRGAMGVAPDAVGQQQAWVQIGMSSTIDPATFVRPSQTLVAVVDVSGSMGWGYPNDTTAGTLAAALLGDIVDQLQTDDQLALVAFGDSAYVILGLTPGDHQAQIHAAIDGLHEDGSTNMEDGLRKALPIATGALGDTDAVRILIFSDYNPNVGATEPSEFQQLVSQAADAGVGVTLFGLGLGLDPSVMKAMSEIRGASAFSAMDETDVGKLMEESWPWMVCPIAYDLRVTLEPSARVAIAASYGFPGEAGDASAALEVATVFLSRRKGGMLVALAPTGDATTIDAATAQLKLDYVTPEGAPVTDLRSVSYDGQPLSATGQYLPQLGLARATALALLVSGMRAAAEVYGSDPTRAQAVLEAAIGRFTADAAELGDAELQAELPFANALLALMQQGAPQGNFYYDAY